MKKQLHFLVENRGIMICGANFHHPKYFQGGNATEKIIVTHMLHASHVFPSLEKKSSLNVRFSRWESKWKYPGCLTVAQDGICHTLHMQSEELPVQRHRALHNSATSSTKQVTCPHRAISGAVTAQLNGCWLYVDPGRWQLGDTLWHCNRTSCFEGGMRP